MVKSRRIKCAGHVARMGEEEWIEGFCVKVRRKETTRKARTSVGG
jgi:hypothetical protein